MTSDARSDILARIQQAIPQAYLPAVTGTTPPPPLPPAFSEPLTAVFARALAAMRGELHRVENESAAREFLLAEFQARGAQRVLCWEPGKLQLPGLEDALRKRGVELIPSRLPGLRRQADLEALESIPVGLTAASAGLARTGSIVLYADRDQGRLASLLPPIHFALLRADQLYPDVAAWIDAKGVGQQISANSSTIIITGPSRTADIAQTLTLGAHGPRELHVVLIGGVV